MTGRITALGENINYLLTSSKFRFVDFFASYMQSTCYPLNVLKQTQIVTPKIL